GGHGALVGSRRSAARRRALRRARSATGGAARALGAPSGRAVQPPGGRPHVRCVAGDSEASHRGSRAAPRAKARTMRVGLGTRIELAKDRGVPWDDARARRIEERIRTTRHPGRTRLQGMHVLMGAAASIALIALVMRAAIAPSLGTEAAAPFESELASAPSPD